MHVATNLLQLTLAHTLGKLCFPTHGFGTHPTRPTACQASSMPPAPGGGVTDCGPTTPSGGVCSATCPAGSRGAPSIACVGGEWLSWTGDCFVRGAKGPHGGRLPHGGQGSFDQDTRQYNCRPSEPLHCHHARAPCADSLRGILNRAAPCKLPPPTAPQRPHRRLPSRLPAFAARQCVAISFCLLGSSARGQQLHGFVRGWLHWPAHQHVRQRRLPALEQHVPARSE